MGITAESREAGAVGHGRELHRDAADAGVDSESGLLLAHSLSDTQKSGHFTLDPFDNGSEDAFSKHLLQRKESSVAKQPQTSKIVRTVRKIRFGLIDHKWDGCAKEIENKPRLVYL